MKRASRHLTLKHLLINNERKIGLQFYPDERISKMVEQFEGIQWSEPFEMFYLPNTKANIALIFDTFRGIVWVNGSNFFDKKIKTKNNDSISLQHFRDRDKVKNRRYCPDEFLDKLEYKGYAFNTARTYISCFEIFLNDFKDREPLEISEYDIQNYLNELAKEGYSSSRINQMINSIKFYYEIVKEMPNRFYSIDRPFKKLKLPKVLSKEDVFKIILATKNIKHKCILSLLYSAGLRRQELIDLKLSDIDSNRMMIRVNSGKGNKDRYTILSKEVLKDLRKYFLSYRPENYLFESPTGDKYSATSIAQILRKSAQVAGIRQSVTPHMLRHSFATHLLESGTDIRIIQRILGHNSLKTTEIYTHVTNEHVKNIISPFDSVN